MRPSHAFAVLLATALAFLPASVPAQGHKAASATAGSADSRGAVTPFAAVPSCAGNGIACQGQPDKVPAAHKTAPKAGTGPKAVSSRGEGSPLRVGDIVSNAHIVTEPGRYGLSNPPAGETYAVIGNSLVRMDPGSGQVLSILRQIEGPRD